MSIWTQEEKRTALSKNVWFEAKNEAEVTVASEKTELVVVPEKLSDDNLSQGIVERYGTLTLFLGGKFGMKTQ